MDFSLKDTLIIKYQTDNPEKLRGIKLNNDSSFQLDCVDKIDFKECKVPKNHFTKSGYYYTYHNNSFGMTSIIYEIPKIYINLEKPKENDSDDNLVGIIIGSVIGGLILIGIIIFLIIRYNKRKNNKIEYLPGKSDFILPDSTQVELTKDEN